MAVGRPQGWTIDTDIGRRAIAVLQTVGIEVGAGLTPAEIDGVERRFGFEFAPEHRAMLSAGLPVGSERFPNSPYPDWPRWRNGNEQTLRRRLDPPVEWLLPDDDERPAGG